MRTTILIVCLSVVTLSAQSTWRVSLFDGVRTATASTLQSGGAWLEYECDPGESFFGSDESSFVLFPRVGGQGVASSPGYIESGSDRLEVAWTCDLPVEICNLLSTTEAMRLFLITAAALGNTEAVIGIDETIPPLRVSVPLDGAASALRAAYDHCYPR